MLFDIRGFFPEEYTDAGIWPEGGWIHRSVKRVEQWLMTEADGFVVLTEKAREILFPNAYGSSDVGYLTANPENPKSKIQNPRSNCPVEVVPCCVDLERFAGVGSELRKNMRTQLSIGERYVIAYVGSFGGWYLSDEMFDLFAAAREIDSWVFIMILTQRQTESAVNSLRAKGFGENDYFVGSVSPDEIPRYLAAADAAVSFIKPCYSKLASSPTKNAEYLACGLPMIANPGVGDVDSLIAEDGVGVLVNSFSQSDLKAAIPDVRNLGDVSEKCRDSARARFDLLTVGGVRYRRLYQKLIGG